MMATRLENAVALTRTMLAAAEHQDWDAYSGARRDRGALFTDDLYTDPDAREALYELAELQQRLCAVLGALRGEAMARSVACQRSTTALKSYRAVRAAPVEGVN